MRSDDGVKPAPHRNARDGGDGEHAAAEAMRLPHTARQKKPPPLLPGGGLARLGRIATMMLLTRLLTG
jgi:hypothetical protein